jgi:predicted ester cyclase
MAVTVLFIAITSNAQQTNNNTITKNKEFEMERNKEIIHQLYDEGLNKRDTELLNNFISADFEGLQGKKGVAGFIEPVTALIKGFPDIQWHVENIIAAEDKVVVRWNWKGTHTAQFRDFAATGKTVTNDGMAIYTFANGKIIKADVQTDRLGFLQELEVVPVDVTLLYKKASRSNVYFIDKFFVPFAAKKEFYERMSINRHFIKNLSGFIEDVAYEYTDASGNLICVTVATWKNREAVDKAKEAVQAEYKKQGFDAAAMFKRLNITVERGIYTGVEEH